METIDERAENYAKNVVLNKETYRGDVETAYSVGASDQDKLYDITDEQIQKMAEEIYPINLGLQVLFCEIALHITSELKKGKLGSEIMTNAKFKELEKLKKDWNVLFDQNEQLIIENKKINSDFAGYRINHPSHKSDGICQSCGSAFSNCIC